MNYGFQSQKMDPQHIFLPYDSRQGGHCRSGGSSKSQRNRVCCEVVSPRNIRSYTHKHSPTGLTKCELEKDNNRQANIDGYSGLNENGPHRLIGKHASRRCDLVRGSVMVLGFEISYTPVRPSVTLSFCCLPFQM